MFSKLQKNIIRDTNNNNVKDLITFIEKYCDCECIIHKNTHTEKIDRLFNKNEQYIPICESNVFSILKEFISIWLYLERNYLAFSIPIPEDSFKKELFIDKNSNPIKDINLVIQKYLGKEIWSTPELSVFIENDFTPKDEYRYKKSHRWTIAIAIFAIITTLINLFSTYIYPGNNKKFSLVSPIQISDTLKTMIITTEEDTLKEQ